jgi:hypothetical protein
MSNRSAVAALVSWALQSQFGGKHASARHVRSAAPPREHGGTADPALERRISELKQLATLQGRELKIQFERIAQLQAEWDILRIRFIKS